MPADAYIAAAQLCVSLFVSLVLVLLIAGIWGFGSAVRDARDGHEDAEGWHDDRPEIAPPAHVHFTRHRVR